MSWTRRQLLKVGAGTAGAVALGTLPPAAFAAEGDSRWIALRNPHTSESIDLIYFSGGDYLPTALIAVQKVLRDFRSNEQHDIDPKLMDYLCAVAEHVGVKPAYDVISGYRSPETNEQLRARSDGVAQHSLHMQGRAIDVRVAGVDCADLATGALALSRGGVGYYKKSDFVHFDTGAFRTWKG